MDIIEEEGYPDAVINQTQSGFQDKTPEMNKKLQTAIRYLRQRGFSADRPNTEYAALSGLSVKTIQRNSNLIANYHAAALGLTAHETRDLDEKLVGYLLDSKSQLTSFKDVLAALCGYLLVYRSERLKGLHKCTQIIKLGEAYIDFLLTVLSRKDNDIGVPIHSNNASLKYLRKINKSDPFFDTYFDSSKYRTGSFSKHYKLTQASKVLLRKLGVLLKKNLIQYVQLLDKHMVGVTTTNNKQSTVINVPKLNSETGYYQEPVANDPTLIGIPSICLPDRWTYSTDSQYLILTIHQVTELSLPSMLQVLGIASLGAEGCSFIVPLKNLSSTNPEYGRHYNIFTRLRSEERKVLGYDNYDISGGIQIISFGILYRYSSHLYLTADDLFGTYPMIFKYGYDPDYKKYLREKLAQELNKSVSEVKELLTAYANGSRRNPGKNALLKQFMDESDQLRREVISVIETNDADLRKLAESQSKHDFPEDLDWEDTSEDPKMARKKASVFFFIWTYFEKQIRDAMLSAVYDGIPVHDAIYSKQKLPFEVFEHAIFNSTGFEVKISH